jgi:hypothetical protein
LVLGLKPWFHASNSTAYFLMSSSDQFSCIAWFTCVHIVSDRCRECLNALSTITAWL